ncbi:uncharacterized protein F4822DRAFT_329010 [Hypoxylon trugodes]|uniref:uncharacterized protein n=1 Tax=Hypoxylon trugodes TaxID=326681 RepID=UPI002192250A|nr:uncharacterized protein F4822DRAFT_329010 [Hypoxylon trugodes]KAI1386898.1 hypothetical protein F4822DRAFT_329010 [Hypoxylon trugodes]
MARCDGDDIDIWSGCSVHPQWIALQKEPDCKCNASRPLIRNSNNKASFDQVASLPPTPGGTISFDPTAIPTLVPTSRVSSSTPAPTSPFTTEDTTEGLSDGAKAGLGVGVGLGVPLLVGLIFLAFFLHRRKITASTTAATQPDPEPQNEAPQEDPKPGVAQVTPEKPASPEIGSVASPEPPNFAWYGYKAELAANSTEAHELSGDEPQSVVTPSWNSETLGSRQVSEMSSYQAADGITGRNHSV